MAEDKSGPECNVTFEQSDDEAPEELTFESARNDALSRVKLALDTAKREKEQLKEKRRRRQEMFQEQKKRRLLPTDVLDKVDSEALKQQEQAQEEDTEEEEEEEKLSSSRSLRETYTVTTTRQDSSFQQQAAQDFLRSRLYGPASWRTTNNELLSVQNKKGPNKQAAAMFVKKNWGERLKKRPKQRNSNSAGSTSRRFCEGLQEGPPHGTMISPQLLITLSPHRSPLLLTGLEENQNHDSCDSD